MIEVAVLHEEGWPGTDWSEEIPVETPPIDAEWRDPGAEVRHTFTHFHLRMALRFAEVGMEAVPLRGRFDVGLKRTDLPTVMRKALDLVT